MVDKSYILQIICDLLSLASHDAHESENHISRVVCRLKGWVASAMLLTVMYVVEFSEYAD